ncbi:MAG: GC-type dockerin domain-anchored protein [Phycisphaerales bacterium]
MIQTARFRRLGVVISFALCALAGFARAQDVTTPGVAGPAAFENPVPTAVPFSAELAAGFQGGVPQLILPFINNAALVQEDFVTPQPGKRLRIGVVRDVAFDPAADGAWTTLPDGSRLWAIEIASPSAYQVGIHISGLNLPPGGRMVSYSTLFPTDIEGPWTRRGTMDDGEVWTPQHVGQTLRLEVHLPADYQGPLPLRIDSAQHVYRNFYTDPQVVQPAAAGTCHNDVTCFPTWANTAKAVGRMTFVSGAAVNLCTGQLLATVNNDLTPYFLTANHCIGPGENSAAASLYVCWLYQTSTCNGSPPTVLDFQNPPAWTPRTAGATIVSAGGTTNSDYSLLMLTGALPANLFWAGWSNAAVANGTAVVAIHHPEGDYKRISFGTKAAWTGADCTLGVGSQTIRANWALPPTPPTSGVGKLGVTEGGSSGGGLFITSGGNQVLIGTLSCGPSVCGASAANLHDSYGSFVGTYSNAAVSSALATGADDSPGGNNSCATPTVLTPTTGSQTTTSRILRKTPDFDDWYKLTIPGGARLNVSTTFTAGNGNIDLQAFTACGGAAVAATTGSASPKSLPSTITNTTTGPMDVWVRVYLSSSYRNTYTLTYSYTSGAVTTNNTCAAAKVISSLGTITGTNVGATSDTNVTCGTNGSPDVWFQYTAGFTGILQVDSCGSPLDTVVSIHSACPIGANTNQIACNDNTAGCAQAGRSLVQVNVIGGAIYRIRVAGAAAATGAFQLTLSQIANPPPANDNCASAAILPANGSVAYDTTFATTDGPSETLCNSFSSAQVTGDVWFTYTASVTGTATFSNCANAQFDSRISAYLGACPSGPDTAIACDDDGCGTPGSSVPSSLTIPVTMNQVYKIRLGGYLGATGAGLLNVTTTAAPPSCRADVAGLGGSVGPDGALTADDIIVFLNAFFTNNLAVADLVALGGSSPPDGVLTPDDIIAFLDSFFAGCP